MSRRDGRSYKIVYSSQPREADSYSALSRRRPTRDLEPSDDGRSSVYTGNYETRYPSSRARPSDSAFVVRRENSEKYGGSVIVVDTAQRNGPLEYVVDSSYNGRLFGPARRLGQRASTFREPEFDPQPAARSRTGPIYESEPRRRRERTDEARVADRRTVADDDSDDDRRPRGRQQVERSPPRRLRSAIRGSRIESPDTRQRARARSVSIREDGSKHEVGNQWHEEPGDEARIMGRYLGHADDDDLASETYVIRAGRRRRDS